MNNISVWEVNSSAMSFFLLLTVLFYSCKSKTRYDTIISNGMIYDGLGGEPYNGDIGIKDDSIMRIGDLSGEKQLKSLMQAD